MQQEQVQSYIPPLLQDNAGESLFQLVQVSKGALSLYV